MKDSVRTFCVRALSNGNWSQVSPWGGEVDLQGPHFEGRMFFATKPPLGDAAVPGAAHEELLDANGNNFELQIQGRMKRRPDGEIFLTAELRDHPMRLGLVTRAMAKALLGVAQVMAKSRGTTLRYSFGDRHSNPGMTIPLLLVDRLMISEAPLSLPVRTPDATGTWRVDHGDFVPMKRDAVKFDVDQYVTFCIGSRLVDLPKWSLCNVPGIGTVGLSQFWSEQACYIKAFDEEPGRKGRDAERSLFELELSSVMTGGEDLLPAKKPQLGIDVSDPVTSPNEAKETIMEFQDAILSPAVQTLSRRTTSRRSEGSSVQKALGQMLQLDNNECEDDEVELDDLTDDFPRQVTDASTMSERVLVALDAVGIPSQVEQQPMEGPLTMPWYIQCIDGGLWWCIAQGDRQHWRHHSQLEDLCLHCCDALGETETLPLGPQHSTAELEHGRRKALPALEEGRRAPGLLEEFTRDPVHLRSLLTAHWTADSVVVGVVEAEGRIAERRLCFGRHGGLWWVVRRNVQGRRRRRRVDVDVACAAIACEALPGLADDVPALLLSTRQRRHVFLTKDAKHLQMLQTMLERSISVARSTGRSVSLRFCTPCCRRRGGRSLLVPWKDPLVRWPRGRIVLNEVEVCLLQMPSKPLALSAALLRATVAAQDSSPEATWELSRFSARLKVVDLTVLQPRQLWSFWVNVYHALLLHSKLITGAAASIFQQVAAFNRCSYLVAGHVFSLVEIEHVVLRHAMSKPKVVFADAVLRTWARSDFDLEYRPSLAAPPCSASCFRCRADWRLNLVLNAGNMSCADQLPVFDDSLDERAFEELVEQAMWRTIGDGSGLASAVELPYNLYRYRDDAPPSASPVESTERRWCRALGQPDTVNARYVSTYSWSMRDRLGIIEAHTLASKDIAPEPAPVITISKGSLLEPAIGSI